MKESEKIKQLEYEISQLPAGYISRKTISGKVRQYLQWTENGKKKSKYLDDAAAELVSKQIEKRRQLQQELKELSLLYKTRTRSDECLEVYEAPSVFKTDVLTGKRLEFFIESVKNLKTRNCIASIKDYIYSLNNEKVLILYGLRRTGKTTLIRQTIADMKEEDFFKTAFIKIKQSDTLADVNYDLKNLQKLGFCYVFIDEVTFIEDFIQGAAVFSDIYATSGMKIILSGTDSLGFVFTEDEQLYDRCIIVHTTYIPYKEFEEVLGVKGIDNYISYGGTMSLGGVNYNSSSTFATAKSTSEYVDSAIAKNIQHSLKFYQNSDHFRSLLPLYEKNELTSAINRIVEDINHSFTLDVLTRDFISHDLGLSANNLRRDSQKPTDILDNVNKQELTERLKEALEIKNKEEQTVIINDVNRKEIKEYLSLLDLIVDISVETIPQNSKSHYKTVISQPGLRYSQARTLIEQLIKDSAFKSISAVERSSITQRILNEIKGRMLEEIVLLETRNANKGKDIFKLEFAVGEFDMVIADPVTTTCEIYEIKHSTKILKEQSRHLKDLEKCKAAEFCYGPITRKCILYRGENTKTDDIVYINVEDYLKSL